MKLFSYSIFLSFITAANSLGSATATSRVNNSLRGGTRESEGIIATKSSSMASNTNNSRQLTSQPILTPLQFCSQERGRLEALLFKTRAGGRHCLGSAQSA